jgi:alkylation response protein AidB-like acyl-CoA dehydrogenase
MDFALTDEQLELSRVVRSFLERHSGEADVRRLMETEHGYDEAVWRQLAGELGLAGLAIPESHGGAGYGFVELGVALTEMGRSLLVAPFFSTVVLAAHALLASGDEQAQDRYLPAIAGGELLATVALEAPAEAGVRATRVSSGGGWRLHGTVTRVLDGLLADLVIVAAGGTLFLVERDAPGLTRTAQDVLDPTRKMARLDFEGVSATPLGAEGAAASVVDLVRDLAAVGMAAEQVGGARRCLEISVQYARDRIQFGRPIGSFQSIKHLCADMMLEVESASAALDYALWAAAERTEDLPAVASMTRALCSDTYSQVAFSTIQVLGGIGFTWEHPAHLYLRRAKSSALLFGTADEHRELLMQRLGV